MTDKALEAAAGVIARDLGGDNYDADDWGVFASTAEKAISAYLSALPGETEVVMEQIAHKEQIGIWANELTSALSLSDFLREDWSFDDSVDLEKEVAAQLSDIIRSAITHPGLNLVASLQAMQARAEKAEQANKALMAERRNLIETKRQQIDRLTQDRITAERDAQNMANQLVAAEARVKELEEALGGCKEALVAAEDRDNHARFRANTPREDAEVVHLRTTAIRRARTALKGGSNG